MEAKWQENGKLKLMIIVGTRPEINCKTELELKEASPVARTLLMMMVNGGMKYMPDASSYDRITWESQTASLARGAAEAWVGKTANSLRGMKSMG